MTRTITRSPTAIELLESIGKNISSLQKECRDNFQLYDLVLLEEANERIKEVVRHAKEYPCMVEEIGR